MNTQRAEHEIEHGKKLSSGDAEYTWGWGSPAGKVRAARRAHFIARAACLGPQSRVLEVGCGTGLFTEMLAQTGAEIIAVDISPELLELARRRGLPDQRVQFLAKRFEDCDIYGPFHAVAGSSVLHHLEVEPSLRKIFNLLEPGGMLSFAEPNMLNPQIMVQKNIPWIKRWLGDSPDETAFIRWRLQALLEKIGFREVRITPFDWLHPITPRPLIGVVSLLGKALEKIPVLREFSGSLIIEGQRPAAGQTAGHLAPAIRQESSI
jgi:2-polyprenyl-3-methyl-5-hydroxy-6-metoxy-1,4-benzoquinol methylase